MIQGIVNVLKPTGMSSHDIVSQMRRIYQMKKIGHAGTLDPLAAGVLPVYLGQATRLIEYGDSDTKTYHAEFLLGIATDTEDITGQVVDRKPVPAVSAVDMTAALQHFMGPIKQTPSRYSAISIHGVKAYKLARSHQDFTLPERDVTIHDIRLLSWQERRGTLAVTCSKGTYVRSLIRDLGEYLGTCACMSYLVRVQAGVFTIEEAATLEELTCDPLRYVLPADASMGAVRKVTLSRGNCLYLLQGRPVPFAGRQMTHGEILREPHHRVINGGVAMRVIVTHDLTNDVGALFRGFIDGIARIIHRVDDAALNRLHAVSRIGDRAVFDDVFGIDAKTIAHQVIQSGRLDGFGDDFLFYFLACHYLLTSLTKLSTSLNVRFSSIQSRLCEASLPIRTEMRFSTTSGSVMRT